MMSHIRQYKICPYTFPGQKRIYLSVFASLLEIVWQMLWADKISLAIVCKYTLQIFFQLSQAVVLGGSGD